jgi:hypothetical protein
MPRIGLLRLFSVAPSTSTRGLGDESWRLKVAIGAGD